MTTRYERTHNYRIKTTVAHRYDIVCDQAGFHPGRTSTTRPFAIFDLKQGGLVTGAGNRLRTFANIGSAINAARDLEI